MGESRNCGSASRETRSTLGLSWEYLFPLPQQEREAHTGADEYGSGDQG